MIITLCIDKQERTNPSNELKKYYIEIGNRLCSYDDVYDELIISLNDEKQLEGIIKRRCNIDRFGVVTKLQTEITQVLKIPDVVLFEGTNYVYIEEFNNLNMKIEYLTNVEMNKYYATKMELNSSMTLTAQEFNLQLSKKLNGSDFTHAEIVAKINDNTSEARINADKVDIEANDVLNVLAGNEINLTSKNISINSDKFSVDPDGTIHAVDGEFSGEINANTGSIGGWTVNSDGLTNGTVFVKHNGASTIYTVADLIIMRGYIMGTPGFELSQAMIQHYDLNGDGRVSALDFVILQNLIGISMS